MFHPQEEDHFNVLSRWSESGFGRFNLLEVLTQKILDLIFENSKVKWAQVEVDKPHALRFAESVSITLERSRNEK